MIDENIARVIELEKSLFGEEGRDSVKVLEQLLADDFMEISSTAPKNRLSQLNRFIDNTVYLLLNYDLVDILYRLFLAVS